jgi:hypothetical protein
VPFEVFPNTGGRVTEAREEHPAKANSPTLERFLEMLTFLSEEQSRKAFTIMLVTESGIVIEVREVQRSKAEPLMVDIPKGISTDVREVQFRNIQSPTEPIFLERTAVVRFVQSRKILPWAVVKLSGRTIEVSEMQFLKVFPSRYVSRLWCETLFRHYDGNEFCTRTLSSPDRGMFHVEATTIGLSEATFGIEVTR